MTVNEYKSKRRAYYQLLREVFPGTELAVTNPGALNPLLDSFISDLALNDQQVVKLRFGLADGKKKTLEQIGDVLGVTRERIRQIERRALRRLKHPARANKYMEAAECRT